jgi:hypothetical protein
MGPGKYENVGESQSVLIMIGGARWCRWVHGRGRSLLAGGGAGVETLFVGLGAHARNSTVQVAIQF